jgi:hypothetical protein
LRLGLKDFGNLVPCKFSASARLGLSVAEAPSSKRGHNSLLLALELVNPKSNLLIINFRKWSQDDGQSMMTKSNAILHRRFLEPASSGIYRPDCLNNLYYGGDIAKIRVNRVVNASIRQIFNHFKAYQLFSRC